MQTPSDPGPKRFTDNHAFMDAWPRLKMTWTVPDYIREEVRRQGHDMGDLADGGARVLWMTEAWDRARRMSAERDRPTLEDIVELGKLVEPERNRHGLRHVAVRVGARLCPPPDQVPDMLSRLIEHGGDLSPLEWYKEFERVHPFVDGNGRTGKILLAMLSDTLDAPYFPPADLFGYPIANP